MTETTAERTTRLAKYRDESGRFGKTPIAEQPKIVFRTPSPLLAGEPAPLCSPQGLTHVGSLNADHKSQQMRSYEGQGLSVSQHPDVWKKIARLGSGSTWNVGRAGAQFLDYHEMTAEQRTAIEDWGVERGYVEKKSGFKISTWDDELESFNERMTLDAEDAEWERQEAIDYDSGAVVDEALVVVSTDSFPDPTVATGAVDVDQILSTLWVAECAPELDGVWWEDTYDPEKLSAPRGVLVMARIPEWIGSATRRDDDDEEDLDDDD
jgi:hypothetical protein